MRKTRHTLLPFGAACAWLLFAPGWQCAPGNEAAVDSSSVLFAPGARLEKLAGGFAFTEGPTPDSSGNVYFTDQPNDRIMIWSVEGKLSTFLKPAGRANGMAFDAAGDLIACADEKNELWSINPAGEKTVLVTGYAGRLLNGPNDVWVHPSGALYITDPFYPRSYWKRAAKLPAQRGPKEQPCEGVYLLKADRKTLVLLLSDLVKPNGIVGTPDGKILYVSDIGAGKTYAYDVQADGGLSGKRLFCALGSDGMTIDAEGDLYLTGKGVTVFDKDGRQIARLPVPEPWTGNVCFGGRDRKTLFITASAGLYALRMSVRGVE
jgi:gluconolactonase